jgi:1-acyl-sn-glycerol-3-phosphate acyltransferase
MAKTLPDRTSDIAFILLRPFGELWMRIVAKRVVVKDPEVDFARREPFVLLANHTFPLDVVHVPMPFRITPHIVASRELFVRPFERFVLTWVARCLMTSKGRGDYSVVKKLFVAISTGYPVLLFPEGDITFFGATAPIDPSIANLVKRIGLDVITCRVSGGHLSSPRWAKARRAHRVIELRYELALHKEQLRGLPVPEIASLIEARLANDDFVYQRAARVPHPSRRSAEGLDDVLYVCPQCERLHTLSASRDVLRCDACGTEGRVDEYGFIQGFRFDNTVAWDRYQRAFGEALRRTSFSSPGDLEVHDYAKLKVKRVGPVRAEYRDGRLILEGALARGFEVPELSDVAVTMRRNLHFSCDGVDYVLRLQRKVMPFLRACQDYY